MKGVGNELHVSRKQRLFLLTIFCFLIFSALSYAQTQVPDQPNNQLIGVAAIEAYTKELDTFKKKNQNRVRSFGNVASWDQSGMRLSAPSPKWKEFKSRKARESSGTGDNLFDVADVLIMDERLALAEFWFGSPSGDWSQSVVDYFGDDGTLAKMRSTFAGFNLNPFANREEFGARLVQTRTYSFNGKRLGKSLHCFEPGEKGRQKRCSGDYSRYEREVYLKAQRLPINTLLNFRPLNDIPSIEAYSKSLDGFKKRNPNRARIFGNMVSPNQATYPVRYNAPRYWEEFPTRRARESAPKGYDSYDGAEVWMRNGKLLIAEIQLDRTFVSASRRAIHYFRPNGTLVKIYNQYFESDYHTVQETIYDSEGKVLRVRTRCVDTGGRGPHKFVKCPSNLPPQINDPVYRKVEELPLNELLRSE